MTNELEAISAARDPKRLELLQATELLDSPPEEAFDRFTRLASQIMQVPVAMISLVDANRQFFKSQYGLDEPLATLRETPLSHSFCKHVLTTAKPLVIDDARLHPLVRDNPAILDNRVVAYLGVPLQTQEGQTLGSLCTIDHKPRQWTESDVHILRDLGVWVMTEVQLRLLARHFLASYVDTRNLEMERDELTHMLVHDLRNPLSSLMAGLELAQHSSSLDAKTIRYLETARKSAQSLVGMIGDILEVSKAEAGQFALDLKKVDPAGLVKATSMEVDAMAQAAGVMIIQDVEEGLPALTADEKKLHRVLVNLLSNAVQHTPRPGTVKISAQQSQDLSRLVLKISDTGVGVPPEAFGQIFEKFNRVQGPHYRSRVSSGLGLPFCKKAVQAHGGTISVTSELGQGTVFELELPLGLVPGSNSAVTAAGLAETALLPDPAESKSVEK